MAKVYFTTKFDADSIRKLFLKVLDINEFSKDERIAIKVHFGEKGNTRFVRPEDIKPILDELKKINNNHFLTDSNTLYMGSRGNAKDHKAVAIEHGFGKLNTDIIIADGDSGEDESEVEINKPTFDKVKIGKAIAEADSMIVISHFKGHMLFSFAGALKNIGMGSGSRAGKLQMHSKISPTVDTEKCIACGECIENCAVEGITMVANKAHINENCVGCAKCISVCKAQAIQIPWHGASSNEVQERCMDYAFGAAKGKKLVCVNFINKITKHCDCLGDSKIIGKDVGIVASTDPVACDKASYDLVLKNEGKDIFKEAHGVSGLHIFDYADKIRLGSKEYTLIEI